MHNATRTVLVTGGLGYIASHIVVELLSHQYNVIIADNLRTHLKNGFNR